MIVQESISETLTKTYSDAGFYIHGGNPEGDYAEAIDPTELIEGGERVYTETDIPIPTDDETDPEEATVADYQNALTEMGVDLS